MMRSAIGHIPVLVKEVLETLEPRSGKIYLDVTFGGGGHTRALLDAEPGVRVYALDWDLKAAERAEPLLEEYGERFAFVWGGFGSLYKIAKKEKFPLFDGILADFGTSQYQLQEGEGFSFNTDTPLDMRMSQSHFKVTAKMIVNNSSERELAELFFTYGEESAAKRIAKKIVEVRAQQPIETTGQLAKLVASVIPFHERTTHPATKVFQALRICVNHELEQIESLLAIATSLLNPGGRLACITFHSLEDRLVKQAFKQKEKDDQGHLLRPDFREASDEEKMLNPSSRSAKLRVFEKGNLNLTK